MADELEQEPLDEALETNNENDSTGLDTAQELARLKAINAKLSKENGEKRIKARDAVAESEALKARLAKVDDVSQTVERIQAELEAEKTARRNAELQSLKLQVAATVGLPPELAARLNGSTLEEITLDATQLAGVMPKSSLLVVPRVGQGAEAPKPSRAMDILRNIDGKAQNPFDIEMHRAKGGGFGRAED